jgi:hypothetical protein
MNYDERPTADFYPPCVRLANGNSYSDEVLTRQMPQEMNALGPQMDEGAGTSLISLRFVCSHLVFGDPREIEFRVKSISVLRPSACITQTAGKASVNSISGT